MASLKKLLPSDKFDIRDFDERGVPDGGGDVWHSKETKHWLDVATTNAEQGKSTIIFGLDFIYFFNGKFINSLFCNILNTKIYHFLKLEITILLQLFLILETCPDLKILIITSSYI
jgi:hypothetical protein